MDIDIRFLQDIILKKSKKDSNKTENDSKKRKILCESNFFIQNNIYISNKIRFIKDYYKYFLIIKNDNNIKFGEIDKFIKENIDYNKKYVLIDDYNIIYFKDFLFNLPNKKLFFFHLIDSYYYLLKSLKLLNDNNIVFFNLSNKNIVFNKSFIPYIKNFDFSFVKTDLTEDFLSKMINSTNNYALKPIEVHVLFYIFNTDIESLSYSTIEEISNNFVNNVTIFTLFSISYKQKYKENCISYLKKYINKTKNEIVNDILSFNYTWDNYSLSVIFLYIIGNCIHSFSLKDTILNKLLLLLNKYISPDPSKRENIDYCIKKFEYILSNCDNWNFIENIDEMSFIEYIHKIS
jgi:hypothetical protein